MVLPSPKELEKLLKVLRAHGVLQYQSVDLTLVLVEKPASPERVKSLAEETMEESPPEDEIERLMGYHDLPIPDSAEEP